MFEYMMMEWVHAFEEEEIKMILESSVVSKF